MLTSAQKKPNLFIIGAMKSGTTSLHNYLNQHPDIYMSDLKEPGFFVEEINWNKGIDWYLSLFSKAGNAAYVGESSTHYTKLPLHHNVIDKLYEFNPDARFIYIVRNPMDRIISHYWHAVRNTSTGGVREDIYTACTQDPEYLSVSNYAMQIRPYIEKFGRDNICVLSFEEMTADTPATMLNIYKWLGLEPMPLKSEKEPLDKRWNARPSKLVGLRGPRLVDHFRRSALWEKISPLVPSSLTRKASKMLEKDIDPTEQESNINRLKDEFGHQIDSQIQEFCQLTGIEFDKVWSA